MALMAIIGDLYAGACNEAALVGEVAHPGFREISEVFAAADLVVANLESPVTLLATPRVKVGPNLRAAPAALRGVARCGIGVLNLANNHIMDHEEQGLASTLATCREYGIATVGAGRDLAQAGALLRLEVGGVQVGLLCVAERDGVVATETTAGPFPADPVKIHRWFLDCAPKCDRIVVLVHGGLEHFPFPTPRLRDFCRFLVDCGADAVICQHTHIVGCSEVHAGVPIVYGQGNFLFDYPVAPASWWEGLIVELELAMGGPVMVRYRPVTSQQGVPGVRLAEGASGAAILAGFLRRSAQLGDAAEFDRIWRRHCSANRIWYLDWLDALPLLLRKADSRLKISAWLRPRARCRSQHNVIACESHRDVLLAGLEDRGWPRDGRR
jgi:hypothetical protein